MTKDELRESFIYGKDLGYTHMIVIDNRYDYEYDIEYVSKDESVLDKIDEIKSLASDGIYEIKEVYDLNMDMNTQLNENRCYHIENNNISIEAHYKKAYLFAKDKHEGKYRKNGSPYIIHPLRVAELVKKYKNSKNIDELIDAALLHDTLEDTDTTFYEIKDNFGIGVAELVLELTSNKDIQHGLGKTKYLEYKLKSMTSWALDIKLCDRLDNISDFDIDDIKFVHKYIKETIDIINFLLDSRELTKTHLNIIRDIVIKINEMSINKNLNDFFKDDILELKKKIN